MKALDLGLFRKANTSFLIVFVSSKLFYVQKKFNQLLRTEIKLKCKYLNGS